MNSWMAPPLRQRATAYFDAFNFEPSQGIAPSSEQRNSRLTAATKGYQARTNAVLRTHMAAHKS
jgi:hypothetical protein